MVGNLHLSERLPNRNPRQPKELSSWSKTSSGIIYDDSALNYLYLPVDEVKRNEIDLSLGHENFTPSNESLKEWLDPVLDAVARLEKADGRKVDANLFTWRGLLTSVFKLAFERSNSFAYNACLFDGQIFLAADVDETLKLKESEADYPNKNLLTYTGYKFEQAATLKKPWGDCTRKEIEDRYTSKSLNDESEYGILVTSGVGTGDKSIKAVYGAEIDCTSAEKDPANPLANYVELKTSNRIQNRGHAERFEKKLFFSWIQSFLVGVPEIMYGFRDPKQFKLVAVESYRTKSIPKIIKANNPNFPFDFKQGVEFYARFLEWLTEVVTEENVTYRITYTAEQQEIKWSRVDVNFGREVSFLSDQFVSHRRSLQRDS